MHSRRRARLGSFQLRFRLPGPAARPFGTFSDTPCHRPSSEHVPALASFRKNSWSTQPFWRQRISAGRLTLENRFCPHPVGRLLPIDLAPPDWEAAVWDASQLSGRRQTVGQCPDSCVICVISVRRFRSAAFSFQATRNARILASFASFASWKSSLKRASMDARGAGHGCCGGRVILIVARSW